MVEAYGDILQLLKLMDRNTSFFNRAYERFKSRYPNEYIAIDKGRVIAHDRDYQKLRKSLEDQKIDLTTVLMKYVPEKGVTILY
jgi:septum formation topological specificity factor MinE